jgi:hypothetical protein
MLFLRDLFAKPYPSQHKEEVERLLEELIRIGKSDDYLSERPGGGFNSQCRHIRTREIGKRLDQIGGLELMEYANRFVKRKAGKQLSSHLEYAWTEIGKWMA